MKKLLSITVKGKSHTWSFNFYGDDKYLDQWRDDGLDIDEVVNVIPEQIAAFRLTKIYCFLQDMFNFKWFNKFF